jgi:chromosome segregation ATPase
MENKHHAEEHFSGAENTPVKDKARGINKARDINQKLDSLEDNLGMLQGKLEENNQRVIHELQGINDDNTNLTEKVSEAYRQLGGIDEEYKSLSLIAVSIDEDVKKLSVEINDVSKQSADDVSSLNENHQDMVRRVNELVTSSQETNKRLSQSITENAAALIKLGEELAVEINELADATQTRDDKLEQDLDASRKDIEDNKAQILKLQAVDEVLEKRAAQLEESTDELKTNLQNLNSSFTMLDKRTEELSAAVSLLTEQGKEHAGLISNLQEYTAAMGVSLHKLGLREKKHFIGLAASLLVVVILGLVFYGVQKGTHTRDAETLAAGQQAIKASSQAATGALALRSEKLENEVVDLKQQLQDVDENMSSMDGRLDYIAPNTQFGKDSIIRGSQWLAAQSAEHFAIQFASANSLEQLYEIAFGYKHYLKTDVSYYRMATAQGERYVMVVGSFATQDEAASVLWRMPYRINFQQPVISRMADIQKFI